MSQPQTVLKAKDPQSIAAWLETRDAHRAEFTAKTLAFATRYGREEMMARAVGFGDCFTQYAIGFAPDAGPIPEGWRQDSKTGYILPAKRTEAGKAVAAELNKIQYTSQVPGVPELVHSVNDPRTGEGYMGGFRVQKIGQDYYATVTFALDAPSQKQLDDAVWEQVKLSAYHAALEDQQEQAA